MKARIINFMLDFVIEKVFIAIEISTVSSEISDKDFFSDEENTFI